MGREKRIAEARGRELAEKAKLEKRPAQPQASGRPAASEPETEAPRASGVGRAVLQIIALYLLPIGVVLLIGKLIFGL